MESDIISATDSQFIDDNMLCKSDLDPVMFDELGDLDLEANFGYDELYQGLNSDFQLPLWDAAPFPIDEPWMSVDDSSSDSGVSGISIKQEPLSPASSNLSEPDLNLTQMTADVQMADFKMEFPLTPPHDSPGPASPVMTIAPSVVKTDALSKPVLDVLNSKTKIQPKPVSVSAPASAVTTNVPTKPLVLTAQEFAKLTAQGILRFNPPVKEVPAGSPPPQLQQNNGCEEESKLFKRQQRMIKNRESACLSRRRRKEYLQSLEERLQMCINENDKLKEENKILRKKLESATAENGRLRSSVNPSAVTKATCLLSIILLFGLNFSTLSIYKQSPDSSIIPNAAIHHSRSLLSFAETEDALNSSRVEDVLRELQLRRNNSQDLMVLSDLDFALCPMYFNKTESLRLANELNGWVLGHKKELIRKAVETRIKELKKTNKRRKRKSKKNRLKYPEMEQRSAEKPYQMQVFTGYDQSFNGLLNSINRRNDTFYVVSFKRDQLLLPATAHNKTMRPRMSLVMPALNLNSSMQPPVGSLAMMQIDCEVMDTRLLYLRESVVPPHMKDNNTKTYVSNAFRQDVPDLP